MSSNSNSPSYLELQFQIAADLKILSTFTISHLKKNILEKDMD